VGERLTIGFGFTSDWIKKSGASLLSQSCGVLSAKPIAVTKYRKVSLKSFNFLFSTEALVMPAAKADKPKSGW